MTTSHIKTMSNVQLKYVYLLNFKNVFLSQAKYAISRPGLGPQKILTTHFSPDKHGKMAHNLE